MIPNFFYWLATGIITGYTNMAGGVSGVFPSWFTSGFLSLFSDGNGMANIFLPIYPHPEVTGIVEFVGITTVLGFLATMMLAITVIGIVILGLLTFIRILPWNTQE